MKRERGNPEGLALHKKLVDEKRAKWKRLRRIFRIVMLVVCALSVTAIVMTGVDGFMFLALPSGFLLLASLLTSPPEPRLTVAEYKALPGAVDGRGEHACIACGNRGIYRRTQYKTTTVLAGCSSCELPFWASEAE